jgi:hypothetical protein
MQCSILLKRFAVCKLIHMSVLHGQQAHYPVLMNHSSLTCSAHVMNHMQGLVPAWVGMQDAAWAQQAGPWHDTHQAAWTDMVGLG